MANVLGALFKDIADAIRSKTGETGIIRPLEFPEKISSIVGGGGDDDVDTLLDMINGEVIGENQYTVTFCDENGIHLCEVLVNEGDSCENPVTSGRISTPTKEATTDYIFEFDGWSRTPGGSASSTILTSITANKTVYAVYKQSVRYYTINFYDGEMLLETFQATYGSIPSPATPANGDYAFNGWEPAISAVTCDIDYYVMWAEKVIFATASWSKIAEVCASGHADQHFSIGDTKTIDVGEGAGTAQTVAVEIIAFDCDDLADGSGKAAITVMAIPALYNTRFPNDSKKTYNGVTCGNAGGWSMSDIRAFCNGELVGAFPSELQSVIKSVTKISDYGYADLENVAITTDKVWLASYDEIKYAGTYYSDASRVNTTLFKNNYTKYAGSGKTAIDWYLRNTHYNGAPTTDDSWMFIGDGGGIGPNGPATYSKYMVNGLYIVFGFCV